MEFKTHDYLFRFSTNKVKAILFLIRLIPILLLLYEDEDYNSII
jgi:hypothetical protein